MATNRKAVLVKRLTEIEDQLKSLKKDFAAVTKKTKTILRTANERQDKNVADRVRKKIQGK